MIYIVGNGMFGRVAHDLLEANGFESKIIDNNQENAGTKASGNITKPSWVSGLGKESDLAYKELDTLYGLDKISPKFVGKSIDLFYVARKKFRKNPDISDTVTEVGDGWVETERLGRLEGTILVAAGVWSSELIPMPQIDTIVGISFIFDKSDHEPKFSVWAPYKQAISYPISGWQIWFGDGTAIKKKNFDVMKRLADSINRAKSHGIETPPHVTHIGYRPYVKNHKDGYFDQVYGKTWVSTGGGKNGIVLAAIQARKFLETL